MILLAAAPIASGQVLKGPDLNEVPEAYRDKHMPEGWWIDTEVIAEGKRIYEGKVKAPVVCVACHGRNGKPVLRTARDLTAASYIAEMTDSYWYWRIAEGVPNTPMKSWKWALTEEQIWKVVAYTHTFSHGGRPEEHTH